MKNPLLVATFGLILVFVSACGKADPCSDQARNFVGKFKPAFPLSESDMDINVQASSKIVVISFSQDPAIGIESNTAACEHGLVKGNFEDNWGNTGRFVLNLNSHPTLQLLDLGPPTETEGRNTIGLYPEAAIDLKEVK